MMDSNITNNPPNTPPEPIPQTPPTALPQNEPTYVDAQGNPISAEEVARQKALENPQIYNKNNQGGEMKRGTPKSRTYLAALPLVLVVIFWAGYFGYNNYGYIFSRGPLSKSELVSLQPKDVFEKLQEACQNKDKAMYAQLVDSTSSKYIKKSKSEISCVQTTYASEKQSGDSIEITANFSGTSSSSSLISNYFIFTKEGSAWKLDIPKTSTKNMSLMMPNKSTN